MIINENMVKRILTDKALLIRYNTVRDVVITERRDIVAYKEIQCKYDKNLRQTALEPGYNITLAEISLITIDKIANINDIVIVYIDKVYKIFSIAEIIKERLSNIVVSRFKLI